MSNDLEDLSPAIFQNFDIVTERVNTLTDSYRLLVGAAEELTRTPSANDDVINSAIIRAAFLGNIIDQLLVILQIALILDVSDDDDIENPYL